MVEDEWDSELKVISEAFSIAEKVGGRHRKIPPSTRQVLDSMIKAKVAELQDSSLRINKVEIRYLVNAFRLLNKIIEMRIQFDNRNSRAEDLPRL